MTDMPGQRELLNICFSCLRYSRVRQSGALPVVQPANFNGIFLRSGIFCSQCRFASTGQEIETAKKEDAGIQSNPFYEKYKHKVKQFAQSDPDEFKTRIEQLVEDRKPKRSMLHTSLSPASSPSANAAPKATPQPIPRTASYTVSKGLDSVMKMELIQDKSAAEVEQLWKEYHKTKDGVFACLQKEAFEDLITKAQACPTFIVPLPHDDGFEFILMQFDGKDVQFTPLTMYQILKENAPACLTLIHYTELMESQGIVLMSGQYDENVLKREDAVLLVQMVAIYYGKDSPRYDQVETFNHHPDKFDYNQLIKDYNSMYLDRPIKIKNLNEVPQK